MTHSVPTRCCTELWNRHYAGDNDKIAGSPNDPIKQFGGDDLVDLPGDDIVQTNAGLVEKNYNDADTYGARLALGIDLDDDWTLRPTIMGKIQKTNGSFAQERPNAVTGKPQTLQYNPESSKDKRLQAARTIEGKLGNWESGRPHV